MTAFLNYLYGVLRIKKPVKKNEISSEARPQCWGAQLSGMTGVAWAGMYEP